MEFIGVGEVGNKSTECHNNDGRVSVNHNALSSLVHAAKYTNIFGSDNGSESLYYLVYLECKFVGGG